jgi:hypothetical protein
MDRRVVISQFMMVPRTLLIQVQIGSVEKLSRGIQILEDVRVLRWLARKGLAHSEDRQSHRAALTGDKVSVDARRPTEVARGSGRLRPPLILNASLIRFEDLTLDNNGRGPFLPR